MQHCCSKVLGNIMESHVNARTPYDGLPNAAQVSYWHAAVLAQGDAEYTEVKIHH